MTILHVMTKITSHGVILIILYYKICELDIASFSDIINYYVQKTINLLKKDTMGGALFYTYFYSMIKYDW